MAKTALDSYGYELDEEVEHIFTDYRKTHNQGVFDVYTPEMRAALSRWCYYRITLMLMDVDGLLGTIVAWLFTVSIS